MFFEEFKKGDRIDHKAHHVLTSEGHAKFNDLTGNTQAIHRDSDYCKIRFGYPDVVINGAYIAALTAGAASVDTTNENAKPTPQVDSATFEHVAHPGDELTFVTFVDETVDNGRDKPYGTVRLTHYALRGTDIILALFRTTLVRKWPEKTESEEKKNVTG
tara:strand:+ start:9471 stop:9950 length:480 start_codon:yes stop_codon:yes gene_type:complete